MRTEFDGSERSSIIMIIGQPALIHIEASGSTSNSYPIEVYWSLDESEGAGYLINDDGIERWRTMERDFLAKHLITDDDVRAYGTSPCEVCEQLNHNLEGRIVYSERIQDHCQLLEELFAAAGNTPQFTMSPFHDLLIARLMENGIDNRAAELALDTLRVEASDMAGRGGAFELRYLNRLWEGVNEYRRS